ncbi:hypothetical protein KVH22_25555 [Streptomyces olivaceus]|uniref:DUF6415 family natural product biosynthesis protein n=1 Tax=Streptomyces olivaceus TaxID=47716 RepID=UPI001CCF0E47|nr:DUF6415 family natural product biosynthesis protein [Streptomyces olivaceus]MBZ6258886.1 hypothetical protein [Streptomyces olivaceus]
MTQATAPTATAAAARPALPDLAAMRESADLFLGPDCVPEVLPAADDEVTAYTATLRGHLEFLIPELERAVARLPRDSVPRYCALACIGEARGKLRAQASSRHGGPVGHARRLARVLRALCDHYQTATTGQPCRGQDR